MNENRLNKLEERAKRKREAYLRKQGRTPLQDEPVAHGPQPLEIIKEVWAGSPIDDEHKKAKVILEYIINLNKKRGITDEKHMDALGFDIEALKREKDAKLIVIEPSGGPPRKR